MKKKFIIALCIVTLLSVCIGMYIKASIDTVVYKLESVVKIHRVQVMREDLLFQLRKVQTAFISKDTQFATDINTLIADVEEMNSSMDSCFDCHKMDEVVPQLEEIRTDMSSFKISLSRTFTIRANAARYLEELNSTYYKGEELVAHLNTLFKAANRKVEKRTQIAMHEIANTQRFLTLLIFSIPVLVLLAGVFLLKSFTAPLFHLLEATRKLSSGDLKYRVRSLKHEFGELAHSFNQMADSIELQIKNMQQTEQLAVLGQLAAGLAHEIKNPLAAIKVSMEVLVNELEIDPEDKRVLHLVVLEINHINALINELLNYSRPSTPHFEKISLQKVLEKTIETATFSLQKPEDLGADFIHPEPLQFSREFPPGELYVYADPSQLHQIFLNILLNSIESMRQGGKISIKIFPERERNYICVQITDSGPGFDEMTQEKLFEPFFTTKKKGTGLGLSICQRLIKQHKGTIAAYNEKEGGASFVICLPPYQERPEDRRKK